MDQLNDTPPPVTFMTLYGIDLRVVSHAGIDYIDPRPLCEMATMNWPIVQGTLLAGDGLVLYGTKQLVSPNIAFDERPKGSDRPSPFIRADRLKAFLIRIDTEKMRWRGRVEEADQLLEDQERWADALDRVEPYLHKVIRNDH